MSKTFTADGGAQAYPNAKTFDVFTANVTGINDIGFVLQTLQHYPTAFIIRGEHVDGLTVSNTSRRKHPNSEGPATFREFPRAWVSPDFDDIPAPHLDRRDLRSCAKYLVETYLPKEFRGVKAIIQATSSHLVKPNLRIRLWYHLSRPAGEDELKAWLGKGPPDPSVYRTVEPIYTAPPLFLAWFKSAVFWVTESHGNRRSARAGSVRRMRCAGGG